MYSPLIKPSGSMQIDPSAPLAKGLVGWWPLGDQDRAFDLVHGLHGTFNGGNLPTSPGASGGLAYKLNGTSQYVTVSSNAFTDITGPITVSVWFNADSIPANNAGTRYQFVCKGYDGTHTAYFLEIDTNTSGFSANSLAFGTFPGGTSVGAATPSSGLTAKRWTQAVGTFDGFTWRIYVDGVFKASTVDSTAPQSTAKALAFGIQDINGTISDFFPGSLENIRLYNRALTGAEIWQLFREPWAGLAANPQEKRNTFVKPSVGSSASATSTTTTSGIGASLKSSVGAVTSTSTMSGVSPSTTRNVLVRAPYLSTDTIETVINQTLTLSATSGTVTATAGAASFASGDVGKYIRAGAGFGQISAFTSTTVVTLVINTNGTFASTSISSGNWSIAPLSYQVYIVQGAALVTSGSLTKDGFWLGSKDIPNCWYVKMPITTTGNGSEVAAIAVFGNINGSNYATVEANAPPTSVLTSYNRIIIAPYQTGDTITTPGYLLKDIDGGPGSHTTTGIYAIPGITNGYAASITQTPTADGIQGMELWDGG